MKPQEYADLPTDNRDALVHEHVFGGHGKPPAYTTDENDSKRVVNKLRAEGFGVYRYKMNYRDACPITYGATFHNRVDFYHVNSLHSRPVAVAAAALTVRGIVEGKKGKPRGKTK